MRSHLAGSDRSFWLRFAMLCALLVWTQQLVGLDLRTGQMAKSFIHYPLMVFHEAGHAIFSPLGHWPMVAGGTLMQLMMPAVMGIALWRTNRDAFGAAMGAWFFGVSLLDIAPYAYDALTPRLTLLNGKVGTEESHDWMYLLTYSGVRDQAHAIGQGIHQAGRFLVWTSLAVAAFALLLSRLGRRPAA